MVLVGTQQTIAGVVKSIELEARPEWGRGGEVPFKVKAVLDLDNGLGAYIDTSAGALEQGGFRGAQVVPGGHPWAIANGTDEPVLAVWAGDRLTVSAVVGEVKTSRRGNRYVSANRAKITAWSRPEWAADGRAVVREVPRPAPRPAPAAPVPDRDGEEIAPAQAAALHALEDALGLARTDPVGLTRGEASRLLVALIARTSGPALPEVAPPPPAPAPRPQRPAPPAGPRWPASGQRPGPARGPRPSGDGLAPDDAVAALRRAMGGA